MTINHNDAISVENIILSEMNADINTFNNILGASLFETNPIAAATLCIGRLYKGRHNEAVASFLDRWRYAENGGDNREFVNDLKELIQTLKTE